MNGKRAADPLELPRRHLLEGWAPDALPRAIVAEAPAGFGKTTFVLQAVRGAGAPIVVDARSADGEIAFARALVEALVSSVPPATAEALRAGAERAGAHPAAWRDLVLRAWRCHDVLRYLVVDNAEALTFDPPALELLNRLFEVSPDGSRVAVCTRLPLRLRLGRVAPPHETLVVRADRLRFTAAEIAAALGTEDVDAETVQRAEAITQGWPIAVLLLRRVQHGGRDGAELGLHGDQVLADYLSDEVLGLVSVTTLAVLIAAAAIPEAREADVAAALGIPRAREPIERAYDDAPFLERGTDGTIRVHPLLRRTLCERHTEAAHRALRRAARAAEAAGHRLRAAQLLLLAGEHDAAAIAVGEVAPFFAADTPPAEIGPLVARLAPASLAANPALWSAAMYFRRYLHEPYERLDETLAVWSGGRPMSPATRLSIGGQLFAAYLQMGRLDQAETLLRRDLVPLVRPGSPDVAFVALWETSLRAYRGRDVDVRAVAADLGLILNNRVLYALIEHDVVARVHRVRGDAEAEREAMARAVGAAEASPLPLARYACHVDAAFTAWMQGDDALFGDLVRRVEQVVNASSILALQHFLDCVHGRPATPGAERLQFRCWGWLIAASQEVDPHERRRLFALARAAAEESAQPYASFLASIATAVGDENERERSLEAAAAIAATIDVPFPRDAVAAIAAGTPPDALRAFVERFAAKAGRNRIEVGADRVIARSEAIGLSDRPREIVTYLALAAKPVPREHLLADIWPDDDPQRSNATLRTLVSRVRQATRDRGFIVSDERGYALGPHVAIDVRELQADIEAAERNLAAPARLTRIAEAMSGLAHRLRQPPAWPWFERHQRDLERLLRRGVALLGASPEPQDRLRAANVLLQVDPVDEEALRLMVLAHVQRGDRTAAIREVDEHERYLRQEIGVEEASPLRALLER